VLPHGGAWLSSSLRAHAPQQESASGCDELDALGLGHMSGSESDRGPDDAPKPASPKPVVPGVLAIVVGAVFATKEAFFAACQLLAASLGFRVRWDSNHGGKSFSVVCSRAGNPRPKVVKEGAKQRVRHGTKCGCGWRVHVYREADGAAVRVTSAALEHTNGCVPSPEQRMRADMASGAEHKLPDAVLLKLYEWCRGGCRTKQIRKCGAHSLFDRQRCVQDAQSLRAARHGAHCASYCESARARVARGPSPVCC